LLPGFLDGINKGVNMGIGNFGMWEVLIIFLVILVFFGAKRLPELAKGMGKGIREFKDALNNVNQEIHKIDTDKDKESDKEKKE